MNPLDVLAEPRRRQIMAFLANEGESSVSAISQPLPVSRPAVSQHPKVLLDAGVVVERRNGRSRLYRIDPDGLARIREAIELFLLGELTDLQVSAERLDRVGNHLSIQPQPDKGSAADD